jgi:hypothetical protein
LGNNYLDPYAIDNNKFTYAKQYLKGTEEGTNKIKDRTAMFNDFSYDEEGEIQASLIRPYYEYKNIELYVPYSQLENGAAVEGFLYGMDPQNRSDKTG